MKYFLPTRQPVLLSLTYESCWRGVVVDPLGISDTTWPCSVRVLVEHGSSSRALFGGSTVAEAG